mgnify:FL=1|jgi:hypothetical protein|tara:strand:+ start:212 stop:595 length:384 start_codon:yes stop_codon:yes gene_type:complete
MNQKLTWNKNIITKLSSFFIDLGLNTSQATRLIDEIDKSVSWNEQLKYYSDSEGVLLDGPLDDETCIDCLLRMQFGIQTIDNIKEKEQWDKSPHANCRCNYSYKTNLTIDKKKHIRRLVKDFVENNL